MCLKLIKYILYIYIKIKIVGWYLDCAECGEDLKNGQALYALDRQWHIYCFKCHECSAVLHGEYMGRYVLYITDCIRLSNISQVYL